MDVSEYLKKKAEFDEFVRKQGGDILKGFIKDFFESHPEVTALRWQQYTPYFNDGDACVFSVYDPYLAITELTEEDEEEHPDDSENWISTWGSDGKLSKATKKDFDDFSNSLTGELSDLCENAFGDHVEVVATRNKKGKIVFKVDEYQHD